jgi:hypothetical protein
MLVRSVTPIQKLLDIRSLVITCSGHYWNLVKQLMSDRLLNKNRPWHQHLRNQPFRKRTQGAYLNEVSINTRSPVVLQARVGKTIPHLICRVHQRLVWDLAQALQSLRRIGTSCQLD